MVIKRCIVSTGRLFPWVNLVVWGHGPWVLPLKWVRFPPYKYIFDGHQNMYPLHLSVLAPGSTLWCGVMPGCYLWNEWYSHPIDIYCFHGSLSPGSTLWYGVMAPWVPPLKWVRFPPHKYIFDGHQAMYRFHRSVLSPGSTLSCWVMPVSYLWNEWDSHPINIYLLVIERLLFPLVSLVHLVVWGHGTLGPTSEYICYGRQKIYCFHWSSCPLGQPWGVRSWHPGSYLWNEWDSHSINIYLMVIKRCIVSTGQSCPLC
jgi:hypothetical protein